MTRLVLAGAELEGLEIDLPAASIRLLVPSPGSSELVTPTWDGNEFLLPGGDRPIIRTLTPRRLDAEARHLELHIVLHQSGALSDWARGAAPGGPAAVSGPGRGYRIDPKAGEFILAGDETAIPAIGQLLEVLPSGVQVQVHVEVAHPEARCPLPEHPRATITWHDLPQGAPPGNALVSAVEAAEMDPGSVRVWAAGEAAAVHRIRRHLFDDRGLPRGNATVRGYWKDDR
jgi:NADPH-dependent ferric siderophore reductase